LLKDRCEQTVWYKAAWNGNVDVLEKLWSPDKELQLKPRE
jgi:hypothetical protein